jgi:hypothetical protein
VTVSRYLRSGLPAGVGGSHNGEMIYSGRERGEIKKVKRKHVTAAIGLIFFVLVFCYSQAPVRKQSVQVTTQSLERLPAGKPYIVDLTRTGKTYTVSTDAVRRIRIRTAKGETDMNDLISKLVPGNRLLPASKLLVGTQSDLHASNFGRPLVTRTPSLAAANSLTCGILICECDPDIEGDCFGRKIVCAAPMVCYTCDGPDCPPERQHRWTCACIHI